MANRAVLPVYLAFAKCDMKGMDRQKLNALLRGDCSKIRGTGKFTEGKCACGFIRVQLSVS
jgi:hypothetical protein